MNASNERQLIEKKIIYAGNKAVSFKDGTKVKFHFQTRKCDEKRTVIDDSRKMGKGEPLELVLGKKFKLEVWEAIVQKLALNEVAQFTVDKSLVGQYPFVSKTLRDLYSKKEERTHTCAMTIQTEGLGYDDLNEMLNEPGNLDFIMEKNHMIQNDQKVPFLLNYAQCKLVEGDYYSVIDHCTTVLQTHPELTEVQQPEDYEKETWQMSEDERIKLVPQLREKGNLEFKAKHYKTASDHYSQAIAILEQLMLKEKPHDTEWNDLNDQKVPFLLNYAQCKLVEGDYYSVIDHCTTVLQTHPESVKALYRRAKAHVKAWNPSSAKDDFNRVIELDPSLKKSVESELNALNELIKEKDKCDREKLKNLFV